MRSSEEDSTLLYKTPELPAENEGVPKAFSSSKSSRIWGKAVLVTITGFVLYCTFAMMFDDLLVITTAGKGAHCGDGKLKASPTVPQYFQTSPELWAGPTATGKAPFLAQTNPVSFAPTVTFVPNTPLETAEPIVGQGQNESIFHLMGHLSPYFPNPSGFGVAEYPLPPGAKITQVQVSR